jgi:hypothetical protein
VSEHRLNKGSAYYLALFDAAEWKLSPGSVDTNRPSPPSAFRKIADDAHDFDVEIPSQSQEVDPELAAVARHITSQIAEMDATAMREVDGKDEDGYLFVVELRSRTEADLRYAAAAWNSEWCEMFRLDATTGRWSHHGVRRNR